ncbi:MAG: 4'-phosphopantetheinyl transferase superfamily protein, partial [Desulfobulbaceae bacterium]
MQFLHLPEALTMGINKHFAWAQIQTAMLDLDQIRAFIQDGQEKALCREWLQQKEEEKLQTLHYEKRHIEWLGGRICAKQAAHHYLLAGDGQENQGSLSGRAALHLHASNLLIMSGASGRPFLDHSGLPEDLPLPHISISHSRRYAVAVAATSHCGIDIQAGSDSLIRVKDRFCSREEEAILGQDLKELQESDHLTLLWAAKEAVKKGASLQRMPGFLDLAL